MREFKHPPSKGIKYCSILLWVQSAFFLLLPLTFFGGSNSNSLQEQITSTVILLALGVLALIAGRKLKEAKKWAWVAAISFCFVTLGSPSLPFSALGLYFLFKKESMMYFTLPHIPKNQSEPGGTGQSHLRA